MMKREILLYSHIQNSRTAYIFSYLVKDLLGAELLQTHDPGVASAFDGPVIYYTSDPLPGRLCIRPSGLLEEDFFSERSIKTGKWDELPVIFATDPSMDVPFDIFSASFWLITRYEEYLSFSPDIYSRFPATDSLAYREGFLNKPVINLWTDKLASLIKKYFPKFEGPAKKFNWLATIDVDSPWAFLHKSPSRTWGGFVKSMVKGDDLGKRIRVLRGEEPDPFYTFDEITELHGDVKDKLRIFMLSGKPGKYDPNVDPGQPAWRELVAKLAAEFSVGLHPSYLSNRSFSEMKEEYDNLSTLLPYPLENSRQHFLKLRFPETYERLAELGIRNDYTMGYPACPGFRAGVCTPFYFYDLKKEIKTDLRIWPFALMDRTLKDYLGRSPEESILLIEEYIGTVEKAGGWFIPVWHNESLSDFGEWKGWKDVYLRMLETLKSKTR
jgi:hypothetical protein